MVILIELSIKIINQNILIKLLDNMYWGSDNKL